MVTASKAARKAASKSAKVDGVRSTPATDAAKAMEVGDPAACLSSSPEPQTSQPQVCSANSVSCTLNPKLNPEIMKPYCIILVPSLILGLRVVQGLRVVPVFLYRYSMNN